MKVLHFCSINISTVRNFSNRFSNNGVMIVSNRSCWRAASHECHTLRSKIKPVQQRAQMRSDWKLFPEQDSEMLFLELNC